MRSGWTGVIQTEFNLEEGHACPGNNLQEVIDSLASLKIAKTRKNQFPWTGTELQLLVNKRDTMHRLYKRTGNIHVLHEFLRLRKEIEERSE